MAQQVATFVENNFTKGLITESTGLNFPADAATSTDNCTYTLIGDVTRRQGINTELNGTSITVDRTNKAMSSYKWNNVGGDGSTQVVVEQIGATLYFYKSSAATVTSPLSNQLLSSTIDLNIFKVVGTTLDLSTECQYTDGNGYLFVFHPGCEPFYCTYNGLTILATQITVQIRDFVGAIDNIAVNTRPTTLSDPHLYNLINQGWTQGSPWTAFSGDATNMTLGIHTFSVASGLPIVLGDRVSILNNSVFFFNGQTYNRGFPLMAGTVTGYSGSSLSINVTSVNALTAGTSTSAVYIQPTSTGYINTWQTSVGNYPSNADVWWYFKDSSNNFNPTITASQVTLNTGPAPKGHYVLNAFSQQRDLVSGITSVTNNITNVRPRTGTWFQGRVWFAGADASQQATGTSNYYTWTENIYFSQIATTADNFGHCYQTNDPTSEKLFDLLPTDGGVITIQGAGAIYKLFPLVNALLVFAANGVWYITGSAGIGFTANDYTIVKLSSVQSISSTSFVDVQGLPMFWNEEGIYKVEPAKQGTSLLSSPLHVNPLEVNPVTIGTILSFYNQIPLASKKYVKGAYHPIDYIVQWIYRSTNETDVTSRYAYDKILNLNVHNTAFFPYTINNSTASINGILYVAGPGGSNSPAPTFKYFSSFGGSGVYTETFAEELDSNFVDWGNINYTSYFVTGYKLQGQAIKKFQPQYLQVYTRLNGELNSYKIQSIWDYANDRNSGRWSSLQRIVHGVSHFDTVYKRIKLRGNGYAIQFKITSTDGKPFDIQGWAMIDTINAGA